jgi:type II secretory pathway component GspD/PulD (secretin)
MEALSQFRRRFGALMEVVPLKYADVGEIVGVLVPNQQIPSNDTFTPQEQNFGTSQGGGTGFSSASIGLPLAAQSGPQQQAQLSGGNATTLGQQINENSSIDGRLNAIVLTGTRDVIDGFKAKIAQLDIPLPCVVLETHIVELTDSAARDVGIDFTNAGGPIATATLHIKSGATAVSTACKPQCTRRSQRAKDIRSRVRALSRRTAAPRRSSLVRRCRSSPRSRFQGSTRCRSKCST